MTNFSSSLKKFGIYLAKVHFSDKPEIYKVRPVVVLEEQHPIVLVLKVTSKIDQTKFSAYYLDNWINYGLNVPSSVIVSFAYQIKMNDIFCDKLLGILNETDVLNILSLLEKSSQVE
jgi:hypothetical protein